MANQEENEIRVRLAPSPTGPLHVGTARTALFNYLFAKKNEGKFILRIEDTDPERSKDKWEKNIIKNLEWLGLNYDEGPTLDSDSKGSHGPYRQSERMNLYKKYLERLLEEDKAYRCFCTKEELEAQKEQQIKNGEPPRYTGKCRSLTEEEVQEKLEQGKDFVIRLKNVDHNRGIKFDDVIRGEVEFESNLLGDFALSKKFEQPLYNFAVVVDDYKMDISHVIRGEDHIPNTPKQILVREALEFEESPKFAHLPLILGADESKLSKRHGAVSITEYRKQGYLPEALINFMAFL
ncbi:MAG: glutamate--tRNA ligase, partial [Candidatus Paceibacterota bacterium]